MKLKLIVKLIVVLFGATHRSGLRIKNDSTDFLDAFSYVLESLKFGVVCHFLKLPVI